MIPFYDLKKEVLRDRREIIAAFTEVLDDGWYIAGKRLGVFEREFAQFVGARQAIGVGNGLDALVLALNAQGIGPGDEVIVPAHTFVATWLAVSKVNATIVPVDVDRDTCLLDLDRVGDALTSKTRAIIPVHLFGQPVDIPALQDIIGDEVFILEDAAQAHGASIDGQMAGNLGDAGAFSFYPAKTLGALGDGGAITSNNAEFADKVRALRNYGSMKKYVHEFVGTNSRLDEVQAAILSVKLRRLKASIKERNDIAEVYDRFLLDADGVQVTTPPRDGITHARHLYVARVANRRAVMEQLSEYGVQTQIHYPITPYKQKCYSELGFTDRDFPNAAYWASSAMSLPLTPGMPTDDIMEVVDKLAATIDALKVNEA